MKKMFKKTAALVLVLSAFAAPLSAAGFSISKPEPHWMIGDWSSVSGTPMTVSVRDYSANLPFLMISVPSVDIINFSAHLRWDDERNAFELWTGASYIREGRVVTEDVRTWGYVWPSSGKDASSETLLIELNSHGQTFEAVLEKEIKTFSGLGEESLEQLRGTWVSQSGLDMKIILGKTVYDSSIEIGDMSWQFKDPQWDAEVSKIMFFAADLSWKGEPVEGPDGVIYGEGRDFRLCTGELSNDGNTLTLTGVHGYNSFKMPYTDTTESDEPIPFTSVLVRQ
ncbi:MAG: hypothetical protein LBS53_05220 [Synergistaceae bacterium]|jgi:hypothetical protein|nr:hypothetical protein [Synergistaceae bacterium]